MKKLLHIARNKAEKRVWIPAFIEELEKIGDLTIIEDARELSETKVEHAAGLFLAFRQRSGRAGRTFYCI